jgi:AraC-like DNA-binding protein
MSPILSSIQFGVASSVLIFAVIQLIYRNSGPLNRCMSISMMSLGYAILYFWCIDNGLLFSLPLLVNTDIPVTFFAGAGIYLTFTTLLGEEDRPPRNSHRHFIVPSVLLALILLWNSAFHLFSGKTMPVEVLTRKLEGNIALHALSLIGDLVFTAYTAAALLNGARRWKQKKVVHTVFYLNTFAFLLVLCILGILFVASRFFDSRLAVQYATILCGVMVIVFCVIALRYPEYSQRVLKTVNSRTKRRENLGKYGEEELMAALGSLMEKKKVFTDPELTLKDVGKYLEIQPQALSVLINQKMKMNFSAYINHFRIASVCRELLADKDTSIMEIAFRNGFNSKSTFNTAFQEITGTTPREFRKTPAKKTQE